MMQLQKLEIEYNLLPFGDQIENISNCKKIPVTLVFLNQGWGIVGRD